MNQLNVNVTTMCAVEMENTNHQLITMSKTNQKQIH